TGVAIHVEEKGNLNGYAATRAVAVVSAVARVATLYVNVDRIVAVADRIGNFLADFGHNRGSGTSVGSGGEVDEVSVVSNRGSDLTVRTRVFIGGFRVVGVAEAGVPGIEAGDLVADKTGVIPARSPENSFADRRGHDDAAMVGHVGIVAFGGASK